MGTKEFPEVAERQKCERVRFPLPAAVLAFNYLHRETEGSVLANRSLAARSPWLKRMARLAAAPTATIHALPARRNARGG